jgi:hypothetical protein
MPLILTASVSPTAHTIADRIECVKVAGLDMNACMDPTHLWTMHLLKTSASPLVSVGMIIYPLRKVHVGKVSALYISTVICCRWAPLASPAPTATCALSYLSKVPFGKALERACLT